MIYVLRYFKYMKMDLFASIVIVMFSAIIAAVLLVTILSIMQLRSLFSGTGQVSI